MENNLQQLNEFTRTRFWINNPTAEELQKSIINGAFSCTTNPAYCSRLILQEPEFMNRIIDDVILYNKDDDNAAFMVYQKVAKRIMDQFLPIYEKSNGTRGFVTIQDDPGKDEDTANTIKGALGNRKLGKNYMAKIPVISGGIEAIEFCIEENIPICATEVFAISQAITICELYEKVSKRTGNSPPFFVTHISGIFDEYLGKVAKREKIPVSDELINQAGVAIAKKQYDLFNKRGYRAVLLGGGARGMHHFTELTGGNAHITMNWSTAKEIIDSQITLNSRIDVKVDQRVIDELCERFIDFKKAYDENGMGIEEFASFGPVQLFRNAFLKGWYLLLAEIVTRRHRIAI